MQNGKTSGGSAAAVAPATPFDQLRKSESLEQFCLLLSKLFRVRNTEVALLRLERGLLKFVCPEELKTAGAIPVSSSTAIAAHTASTKKVEIFNNFTRVKHVSIFETVKLTTPDNPDLSAQAPIQKMISAPVLDKKQEVLGVIQVSRKGYDLSSAGPDFNSDDLQKLESATAILSNSGMLN